MTVLSYNGKKKDFKAGSPPSVAAKQIGMKVTYSCKSGQVELWFIDVGISHRIFTKVKVQVKLNAKAPSCHSATPYLFIPNFLFLGDSHSTNLPQ
jgi:hypothetical protein